MRLKILVVMFALFVMIFCSTERRAVPSEGKVRKIKAVKEIEAESGKMTPNHRKVREILNRNTNQKYHDSRRRIQRPDFEYTLEEERFIISQILSLGSTKFTSWVEMKKAHDIARQCGADGFIAKRTAVGLRQHFNKRLMYNLGSVSVPDTVKEIVRKSVSKYSREEDDLIIEEVMSSIQPSLRSTYLWKAIRTKFDQKRESGYSAFGIKRSEAALRWRFGQLVRGDKRLLDAAKVKFPNCFKYLPGCSKRATIAAQQRRRQSEGNLNGSRDQRSIHTRYTEKEEHFIINYLLYLGTSKWSAWKEIGQAHELAQKCETPGFMMDRTAAGLREHFNRIMLHDKGLVTVPDSVKTLVRKTRSQYTSEEDAWLINEVLSSSQRSMRLIWDDIKRKHDQKREAGDPVFEIERTKFGLRSRFGRLVQGDDQLMEAAKQKFPQCYKSFKGGSREGLEAALQSSTESTEVATDPGTQSSEAKHSSESEDEDEDEPAEFWDSMINDLYDPLVDIVVPEP